MYLPPPSFVYSLVLVLALLQVLINDLLFFPGMREYCVSRGFAADEFAKDNLAVRFALQEAYTRYGGGSRAISWQERLVSLLQRVGTALRLRIRC
ncbi:uncharacterized protein K444DRAFT_606402 [Hyaloscypha bicolor E]|uniref:Uncharacterized protein n=1 Tax=Hyaloscypha bicolor E TaxID=1095630 RepID=A0A2J6TWS0_9HELO|nr:uncharacterized protein K444DRAFT_606402 [Hyaloscypha bicolor E]PMD67463.1 hypothetical protein K444DRAFT_606402 [Hyaloscypha bicolor E]